MQTTYPRIRRWTRVEYDRLIDQGVFQPGEPLELLAGQLVVREPQGDTHSLAAELVQEALRAAFGPEWRVRTQLPVALDDESEPEPDVSVAAGRVHRGAEAKPSHVLEVYRDPAPDPSASYGWTYRSIQSLTAGQHVSLLAAPTSIVAVLDLLP